MRWMIGRGPIPEPPAPDDWSLDRRERLRVLDNVNGNVETARAVWANHTRSQFARWMAETGRIGEQAR